MGTSRVIRPALSFPLPGTGVARPVHPGPGVLYGPSHEVRPRGARMVAGDHGQADVGGAAAAHGLGDALARRVLQADQAEQPQVPLKDVGGGVDGGSVR